MNKSRIFTIVGALLPLLIVLGLGSGCQPTQGGAQSPMRTPTAPSETWPTLTPPPTLPLPPTSQPEPTQPATPIPVYPTVPLTPIPTEKMPEDVQAILYTTTNFELNMGIRQALIDSKGQRWGNQQIYGDRGLTVSESQTIPIHNPAIANFTLSPDQKYLAIDFQGEMASSIVVNLATGVTEQFLPMGFGKWLSNGFYYRIESFDRDGRFTKGVFVISTLDNLQRQEIELPRDEFDNLDVTTIAMNPEGTKLLFATRTTNQLWVLDLETDTKKQLTQIEKERVIHGASFSPDGQQLMYLVSSSNYEVTQLIITNFTDEPHSDVTLDIIPRALPVWSPDSSRVLFIGKNAQDERKCDSSTSYNGDIYILVGRLARG